MMRSIRKLRPGDLLTMNREFHLVLDSHLSRAMKFETNDCYEIVIVGYYGVRTIRLHHHSLMEFVSSTQNEA